jgi:hypothetical protein
MSKLPLELAEGVEAKSKVKGNRIFHAWLLHGTGVGNYAEDVLRDCSEGNVLPIGCRRLALVTLEAERAVGKKDGTVFIATMSCQMPTPEHPLFALAMETADVVLGFYRAQPELPMKDQPAEKAQPEPTGPVLELEFEPDPSGFVPGPSGIPEAPTTDVPEVPEVRPYEFTDGSVLLRILEAGDLEGEHDLTVVAAELNRRKPLVSAEPELKEGDVVFYIHDDPDNTPMTLDSFRGHGVDGDDYEARCVWHNGAEPMEEFYPVIDLRRVPTAADDLLDAVSGIELEPSQPSMAERASKANRGKKPVEA